jgi:hypothetical protein
LRTRIFVTATLPDEARSILEGLDIVESETDDATLAQCQVLMAWPKQAGEELLRKMRSLKVIQVLSAGVDGGISPHSLLAFKSTLMRVRTQNRLPSTRGGCCLALPKDSTQGDRD